MNLLSLDIETFGKVHRNASGQSLPRQTTFHPIRSMATDGCPLDDLVVSVSITLPRPVDVATPPLDPIATLLCKSTPGHSIVFLMHRAVDRRNLAKWLQWSTHLILMNAGFDIPYLRTMKEFRYILNGRHILIDVAHLNYLDNEQRSERSLKTIGKVLGRWQYDEDISSQVYDNPDDPRLTYYNAEDTHNTLDGACELCRRIVKRYQPSNKNSKNSTPSSKSCDETSTSCSTSETDSTEDSSSTKKSTTSYTFGLLKVSEYTFHFYSNLLWTVIRMSESGIPMDVEGLTQFAQQQRRIIKCCERQLRKHFNLYISKESMGGRTGCEASKQAFLNNLIEEIDACTTATHTTPDSCHSSQAQPSEQSSYSSRSCRSLVRLTDKTHAIKMDDENRNLLSSLLEEASPEHPLQRALLIWKAHSRAQKLLGSYCYPLLWHQRTNRNNKSSVLIAGIAYPSWYTVPTQTKDSGGDEGGTLQARITCKNPAVQTFPAVIKQYESSRFTGGYIADADLSQIELRVAALLSGDDGMLSEYNSAKPDLHLGRAIQIFTEEAMLAEFGTLDKKHPGVHKNRQCGKTVNFADLFLAEAKRMQASVLEDTGINMPIEFFQEIVEARPVDRPGLFAWQQELLAYVKQHRQLILPLTGHSRYFPGDPYSEHKSEVVNFPVQTTAAIVFEDIQHEVHKRLPSMHNRNAPIHMYKNVYDAMYFDVRTLRDLRDLHSILVESVETVATSGHWARLCDHYGRSVPLILEMEGHPWDSIK